MAKPTQGQVPALAGNSCPRHAELRTLCRASDRDPANCRSSRQRRGSKATPGLRRQGGPGQALTFISRSGIMASISSPIVPPSGCPRGCRCCPRPFKHSSGRSSLNFLPSAPAARGRCAFPARVADVIQAGFFKCAPRLPRAARKSRACQSTSPHWPIPGSGCGHEARAGVRLPSDAARAASLFKFLP